MKIDKLKKFNIFNSLKDNEVELFIKNINTKSYKKNELIMKEGEPGDSIMFLLNGSISITKALTLSINKTDNHDNREKEFIRATDSDNIIIGEISLFSDKKIRTATVTALKNCEVGFLSNVDFEKICNNNKEVGYHVLNNIIKIITERLILTNHQVLKLTTAFSLVMDE